MTWRLVFTGQARKEAKKIRSAGLRERNEALLELLEKVGGNLLGIVLNNISINQDSYYYYYSGYYYDYYSKNYDSEGGYGGHHSSSGEYGYEGRRRKRRRDKKGDAAKKEEGAAVKAEGEVTPEAQGEAQGEVVPTATDSPDENAGGIKKY